MYKKMPTNLTVVTKQRGGTAGQHPLHCWRTEMLNNILLCCISVNIQQLVYSCSAKQSIFFRCIRRTSQSCSSNVIFYHSGYFFFDTYSTPLSQCIKVYFVPHQNDIKYLCETK